MEKEKRKRFFLKLATVLMIVLALRLFLDGYAFGVKTCSNKETEIQTFLEEWNGQKIEILKISEKDRIKAVIYERKDLGICYSVFEKNLFGLRLEHNGMDILVDEGLQTSGHWQEKGVNDSKCDVIICGDNRDGKIASYMLADVPEAARENLEKDYILDIYILNGIEYLPGNLLQYTTEGTLFEK